MNTIYIDTTAGALVFSPVNPVRVLPPNFTVGDTVSLTIAFLQRNLQPLNTGTPIYNYLDESAAAIILSLGIQGAPATDGTFVLSFGSNSTPPIPYNVSQYTLSLLLNGLASVVTAGGITVSGNIGGPFKVRFITAGTQSLFTAPTNSLFPACSISIATAQTGSVAYPATQIIAIEQAPLATVSSWTPQSSAAITVTSLQANAIQRVAIPTGTYGGTFTLTYNGSTTQALPFNAQFDSVASALNALAGITGATVIPGQNYWDITIPSGSHALTGSASGLMIPLTLTGALILTPQSVADFLAGNPSSPIPVSIQSTASGVQTIFSGITTLSTGAP